MAGARQWREHGSSIARGAGARTIGGEGPRDGVVEARVAEARGGLGDAGEDSDFGKDSDLDGTRTWMGLGLGWDSDLDSDFALA